MREEDAHILKNIFESDDFASNNYITESYRMRYPIDCTS